jgi:hypothetical protein
VKITSPAIHSLLSNDHVIDQLVQGVDDLVDELLIAKAPFL